MYEQVVHGRPLSILLDRSRDAFAGRTGLGPHACALAAAGSGSPVEEHLQLEALMSPTFSTGYGELIEVLFPRVIRE